jgi:hypothetical protein
VQISIAWLKDRPKAYLVVCKIWPMKNSSLSPSRPERAEVVVDKGHGPDGHIHMSQWMVRRIITKMHS